MPQSQACPKYACAFRRNNGENGKEKGGRKKKKAKERKRKLSADWQTVRNALSVFYLFDSMCDIRETPRL